MAGNYFHDPRPFYGLGNHNLMSMDELFYGRREPPPWYQQQMPYGRFDDYPRSRSMEPQRPEQYIQREDQFREYRRPDMRDDVYIGHQHDMHGANRGQQKNPNQGGNTNHGNNNHGGNNHGNDNHGNNNHGNNSHGNNNHGNNSHGNNSHGNNNHGNNKGKNQQKHQNDSDKEDHEKIHKGGNHGNNSNKSNNNHGHQSHNNDHGHGHNKSWSDNRGFHGGRGHGRHRRSLSLTQIVLKKLGLRDDSSSDSSDDDRHGSQHNKKGAHGRVQTKGAHNVRFDDQFHGHSNQSHNKKGGGSEKLGEDHGSHGSHGKKGGGQPQGILKTSKNKHGDDESSSDEGHQNHGKGKGGNQHHGGAESGKKGGQTAAKLGRAQSMDFRVNLCCDNCERKVKKALWKMDVDEVLCDQWNNRVVVTGNAKPESVLKKLRSVKQDTLLWHQPK